MPRDDDPSRGRSWRINWDRLVLVAMLALQVVVVIALLAALVALATH